jgi:hypothetical protein
MRLLAYLKALVADPLFVRVCMALWGMPFVALGVGVAVQWHPDGLWQWLGFACVQLVGVYGVYLLYTAFLGSRARLEKATDLLADGGDIVGAVFALAVAAAAIPITIVLRLAIPRSDTHAK